jgi:predicted DNA-binding transcriptional regulator YafY
VRLLSESFTGQIGSRQEVQHLLQELAARLSPKDQRRLENLNSSVDLDFFQDIDRGAISDKVWQIVDRAVRQQRKICFHYISPRHEDRLPRYHEAAPRQMRFQRGHWYLYAFDLYSRDPYGVEGYDLGYKNFRVQYICADEKLSLSPTRLPGALRTPPHYEIHYRLNPRLARGQISHHFENTQITHLPDGSAEVKGSSDNLWEAAQVLLSYSDGCEVLGCAELRAMMLARVRGMAALYGCIEKEVKHSRDLPSNTD